MTLSRGSKGKEVLELQEDLKALGLYHGALDSDYGPRTRQAVMDFQDRYFVDGITNANTRKAVREAVVAWANRELNILLTVPVGLAGIEATFGEIKFKDTQNGDVVITNGWAERNIVRAVLPVVGAQLVHVKMVPIFNSVLKELEVKGLDGEVKQFGVWCPRHKGHDTKRSLSTHSWAIACDINWATNPYGMRGDMDPGIVAAFERHGFEWGGRWSGKNLDPMHFQLAKGY
jgi:hypothetical protein